MRLEFQQEYRDGRLRSGSPNKVSNFIYANENAENDIYHLLIVTTMVCVELLACRAAPCKCISHVNALLSYIYIYYSYWWRCATVCRLSYHNRILYVFSPIGCMERAFLGHCFACQYHCQNAWPAAAAEISINSAHITAKCG